MFDLKHATMTTEARAIVTVRGYDFCPDVSLDSFRGAQFPSRKWRQGTRLNKHVIRFNSVFSWKSFRATVQLKWEDSNPSGALICSTEVRRQQNGDSQGKHGMIWANTEWFEKTRNELRKHGMIWENEFFTRLSWFADPQSVTWKQNEHLIGI